MPKSVLVGLNGGFVSSVTAALLTTQGYQVHGIYFSYQGSWQEPQSEKLDFAKKIAKKLGVSFIQQEHGQAFESLVLDPYLNSKILGGAFQPCVSCHSFKIQQMELYRQQNNLDLLATGHMVRVQGGQLYRGSDPEHDQSYLLARTPSGLLQNMITPLGDLSFTNLEKMARAFDLDELFSKFSHGSTCEIQNKRWFTEHSPERFRHPGPVADRKAKVYGRHRGFLNYFIGQPLSPQDFDAVDAVVKESSQGLNLFVVGFDDKRNTLIVGGPEDLKKKKLFVDRCQWMGQPDFSSDLEVHVQFESHSRLKVPGRLSLRSCDGAVAQLTDVIYTGGADRLMVFYQGDHVLGSGFLRWAE